METTTSFAPLAARLAAQADKIRPADGARNDLAKIVALVWCLVFAMLIALCEALDTRAAAVARTVAAPAAHDTDAGPVLAGRSVREAMPRARRVLRLVRADDAPSMPLARDPALAGPAAPHPEGHLLAWSPPWLALCWRPPRLAVFREKAALPPGVQHAHFVAIQ